jgi:hypothetical protein
MFALKYPDNYFLISIGIACAIFDVLYIVLLHRKKAGLIIETPAVYEQFSESTA